LPFLCRTNESGFFIKEEVSGASILFTGSANKNRVGFEKIFNDLAKILQR